MKRQAQLIAIAASLSALAFLPVSASDGGNGHSPLVLFGAQSGRPSNRDVELTLQTAKDAGFSDFMVYARSGLELDYMGEGWLALVERYLVCAERLGMGIWLYDEFNWPSGSCRETVTAEDPNFCNTTCALYPKPDGSFDWRLFRAAPKSANVFDADAMAIFRAKTHEVYERRFRRYFGRVIRGMFSDEPGSLFWTDIDDGAAVQFRWYRNLEADYCTETGRDFRKDVEAYCRDVSKAAVWERYTSVMGHAFCRAFADPVTSWCNRMGIVSTGHLMAEGDPYLAAMYNGLVLDVLKGFSFPAVDDIFTGVTRGTAEWLTLATVQHAIGRNGRGGAAELFALGPCDLAFDRMAQMLWLTALHKVDTYFLALHHQTARGFVEKPHYAMFFSPLQPWFGSDMAGFHDIARQAAAFAKKSFVCDVAVRYPQRMAGMQAWTRKPEKRDLKIVELLATLGSNQVTCDLYADDEPCDKRILFDFDGMDIVEVRSGRRFASGEAALAFVRTALSGTWYAEDENGAEARDIAMRRYSDGSAAFLNLRDMDRALVLVRDGVRIPFLLHGRGVWTFRPVAENWHVKFDRPNRRRIRFLADGTAKLKLSEDMIVRFATCALTNAIAKVTLDGRMLKGDRPCTFLGFGYDCDYRETEHVALSAGEHVLTCEGMEDRGLFLPVLWIAGEFAVSEPGTIRPSAITLPTGPLAAFGYQDYAGKVVYSAEVDVPPDVEVLVVGTGHALATASLGGKSLGSRVCAPWEWVVPVEMRGTRQTLELSITTSVRPMFGAESDEVAGALPSRRPKWIVTLPAERQVGLLYAYWR